MPHVVIQAPQLTVESIYLAFEPTNFTEHGVQFKAEEAYLSSDKTSLLIRSLTVERGFPKAFFVRFQQKEDAISLGLDRLSRPDITDAVKRLLGLFVWKILQVEQEAVVISTNIQDYLGEPSGE